MNTHNAIAAPLLQTGAVLDVLRAEGLPDVTHRHMQILTDRRPELRPALRLPGRWLWTEAEVSSLRAAWREWLAKRAARREGAGARASTPPRSAA